MKLQAAGECAFNLQIPIRHAGILYVGHLLSKQLRIPSIYIYI